MMVWSKAALEVSHTWVMAMMMTMIVPKNTTRIYLVKVLAKIINFLAKMPEICVQQNILISIGKSLRLWIELALG